MSLGINLVMTVIAFSLSVLFIVFVCTMLICARIRLIASRRSLARAAGSDLGIMERGLHGLEPLAPANFSTKKYKELCLSSEENAECPVCLADYHEEDMLCILPVCRHSFHATCISIWLQQHSTCPVCRLSLCEPPERKWFRQPMFSPAIRSQYSMQAIGANCCHCMASSDRHSSIHRSNGSMDSIQEVHCRSEGDGVVSSIDHEQTVKNSASDQ